MEKEKYINDLKDIKDLMNRSSKFISLSGWSGISIGLVALVASYVAHIILNQKSLSASNTRFDFGYKFSILGISTLIIAITLGVIFSYNKSKRTGQKIWSKQVQLLLINLSIPLVVGGILCLLLMLKGMYFIIAPLTLIFYGLGLINASKYTLSEIRSLGIINCILGLIGVYFIGYGLILWGIGFGIMHIVYGVLMKIKHK